MRKILISLVIISLISVIVIGATKAYFSDLERSTNNRMTAGSLDLKIDLQCEDTNCDFSLRDLNGEVFFYDCDIKPGDSGEVTISWHVDNNAWARIRLAEIVDYENGCEEPEREAGDLTCGDPGNGEGELDDHLLFTFWMDEGEVSGWQCPDNGPCDQDPKEGDNILNGIESSFAENVPASELLEGVVLPSELIASTVYYLGMKWKVPPTTENIIQTDSLVGKIIMEVVQSRNNPNPW